MKPYQHVEYKRLAEYMIKKAGLEVVAIDPANDYIEVICPKCNEVSVFKKHELENIGCRVCRKKNKQMYFERRAEELIKAAGFDVGYISYEEDYFEIECPECESLTGFHFEELGRIYCRNCSIQQMAKDNGFRVYKELDDYDLAVEERIEQCRKMRSYDEVIVLVCENCGDVYIIDANSKEAHEKIRQLRCVCSATPKGFRKKYLGTKEQSVNGNKSNYSTYYKKDEWPHNFLYDIVNASEYWMEPFDELPADFENSLAYVLNSLPDQRGGIILRMRYKEKLTLEKIGEHFDLTKERVRQIIRDQMQEIRNPFWLRYLRYGINDLVNQCDSGHTKNPIYKKGHLEAEQRQLLHKAAEKWLNSVLTNTIDERNSREKPGVIYEDELNEAGLFVDGDAALAYELEKVFADTSNWHNVGKFARIINTITDYKLLAYILLYKMRVYDSDIYVPRHREFFIVGFERLITLTED